MMLVARDLFKVSLYLFRGAPLPGLPEEKDDDSPNTGPQVIPQNERAIVGLSITLKKLANTRVLGDKTSVVYRSLKTDVVKTV